MWSLFLRNARSAKPAHRVPASVRPRLEALEDRCLMSAGALDPTFGSGGIVTTALTRGNDTNTGVLLQPNGDLIAYGTSTARSGGGFELARYTPSGSLDPTFGSGGIVTTSFKGTTNGDGIQAAALQPDGKIAAAGGGHLIRYNANGSIDTAFGSKGMVTYPSGFGGDSVLILPSGDIVVGGGPSSSIAGFELLRYSPNGKLDSTFGQGGEVVTPFPNVNAALSSLALENGDIVAAGWAGGSTGGNLPGSHLWALARYDASGKLDTTFGPNGTGLVTTLVGSGQVRTAINSLVVQPDGNIVAVGDATSSTGPEEWGLARYDTSGNLDSTFGSGGIVTSSAAGGEPHAAALQPNGQIVVVGETGSAGPTSPTEFEISRYNLDGSLDSTFGSGGFLTTPSGSSGGAYGVAIQSDGKIVAAGNTTLNGKGDFMLARYLASEPVIGSFTANPNPVTSGSNVTLTASNITDGNPNSTITQVTFYYFDANGNKVVLGNGTADGLGDWSLTFTVNLATGSYTLYSQAEDNFGVLGDPAALTLTVQ